MTDAATDRSPRVVREPSELRRLAERARAAGGRIALVPTMGFLHEGHLSLLREARRRAPGPGDLSVLSIFVNPTQFGAGEDLARYPRDLEGDLAKAAAAGADVAFVPDAAAMYPPGAQTFVQVRELARGLCGERRPGHFDGVATIVLKLFQLARPHVALFGEKDYQQLCVIRRMARDLDLDVEVVGLPIVREPDGLALSSRNVYLGPEDRVRARALSAGLRAARERYQAGARDAAALLAAARAVLDAAGVRVDYLELRDAETLAPLARADAPALLAVAALVGPARLIDNVVLGR